MFQVINIILIYMFYLSLTLIKFTLFISDFLFLMHYIYLTFIITNSDKSNIMDKDAEDPNSVVQELKIKLMEKERMISDNESKLKKIQFKTNRDIRELKMSEERVKNQLKQQKAKIEKLNKSLTDAQQENVDVQRTLNQIKQQKEKQIQVLKSQYNNLKNEVRGYERILPTYTFMTKLQKNYEQISPYEQIYNFLQILQQKYIQLEEISTKYKKQSQQKIEMQKKIVQSLQNGKIDLEKNLKQDMIKIFQLQSENSKIKTDNEQLKNKLEEVLYEFEKKIEESECLTEQNKSLQQKIEEIVKNYHSELQVKQIEIRKIMQEEYKRHEEQIENIRRNYQHKQYTHMENLALYEQSEGRLADQIEYHRQQYRQVIKNISEQLENVKNELQKEKKDNFSIKQSYYLLKEQLQLKTNECNNYLLKLGQSQQKFQNLSININSLQQILANQRDQSSRKLTTFQEQKKNLEEKLNELQTQANQMKQDLVQRQGEIQMLHGQIEQLKSKNILFVSQSISPLPTHIPSADDIDFIRNRSKTQQFTQLQRIGEEVIEKKKEDNPQRKSEQLAKYQMDIENDMIKNWNYKELETEISQKMFEAKEQIEKQLKVDFEQKLHEVTEKYQTTIIQQRKLKQNKQKQIEGLKKVIEEKLEITTKYEQKIQKIQLQMSSYINQIIQMKLKVANAQMKAAQKTQQYLQIQKKVNNK